MKLLYFSCHAILEYDEVKLFHELGIDIFSAGAYANPAGHPSLPRPALPQIPHYPELERAASTIRATGGTFPDELIAWADTIVFMHEPEILQKNWPKFKDKRVIFRSIGQCQPHQEVILQPMVTEGLQIVRYSPKESLLPHFAGVHAMIRFYKDPEEYKGYNGDTSFAMNMTQSIRQRGASCFHDEIQKILKDFPHLIYGIGNEELGDQWGGLLSPEEQKEVLRTNRVFVYGGTWPAAYTLSFIEAWMTGIPIVSLGKQTANDRYSKIDYFEIEDFITNGVNGFIGDDIEELRKVVEMLLNSQMTAKAIGENGRNSAISLFGKDKIKSEWQSFLLA